MHITDLPKEILLEITRNLSTLSMFNLATTNKKLYEKIRHFPLNDSFDLYYDTIVGSFFFTTAKKIDLYINVREINYSQLRSNLSKFYYVHLINILSKDHISASIAARIISCIPSYFSELLYLKVNTDSVSSFNTALTSCLRKDILVSKQQSDRAPVYVPRKRTPSPIREAERAVKNMKKWWSNQQIGENLNDVVLETLKEQKILDENSEYTGFEEKGCAVEAFVDTPVAVDNAIRGSLGPVFLESLVKFESFSVLVSQFEVYYRNDVNIDASALPTLTEPYYNSPTAKIREKTEKRNTWFELSIFYKRYEILVTGGIICNKNKQIIPFLGNNIPVENTTSGDRMANTILILKKNTSSLYSGEELTKQNQNIIFLQMGYNQQKIQGKGVLHAKPPKNNKQPKQKS